ncbi:MAG: ShlB/FhaC/HecB family hemolysin secretion/activation protein, partial [Betaproteobacteria bacterium]
AFAGAACAQSPQPDAAVAPRFDISRFEVEGNTLLEAKDIDAAVASFTGTQKDFSDIQRALETLEEVYRDHGYGVVQVLLPEQDITKGVVRLRVIEPKIGKVAIEGNKFFNDSNVRASLPGLKPGTTPNSRLLAQNLQLLAEHPAKQTTVLLRGGETESLVDATIKVVDEKPLKFVATLDNSGTTDTGRFRTGIAMQHSNMFNRDHVLSLQYVTNPEHPSAVQIYGIGYRIPLYDQYSSIELFAGYSDVNSGTLQGLFNVSGSGTIAGGRYNFYLPKIGEYEHKLALGADYRAFQNQVNPLGGAGTLVPDVTVAPVSVAYNGLWRMSNSEFGYYVAYSANVPGLNDGGDNSFKMTRTDATANYHIWRMGATYSRTLPRDWQFRGVINAQYTNDALVPGELFGYGGPDSVRGFNIREVANDTGYSGSLEIYTPELGAKFGWKEIKMRWLGFYDAGTTSRNSIQPGESFGQSGGSVGIGMRMTYGKHVNLRLDFAQVVDPAGTQAKNDQMLQGTLAIPF